MVRRKTAAGARRFPSIPQWVRAMLRRDSIAVALDDERLTNTHSPQRRGEFKITMIDSSVLFQRLTTELRFTVYQLKQAWPDFKRDPIGVGRRGVIQSLDRLKQLFRAPNALAGVATALIIVLSAVLIVIILERVGLIGGELTVESNPGQGTRLEIIVPKNGDLPHAF